MTVAEFEDQVNRWAAAKVPFLFVVDFEQIQPIAITLNNIPDSVLYFVKGVTNVPGGTDRESAGVELTFNPIGLATYAGKFASVFSHLQRGDSFLANLTIRTEMTTPFSLRELFHISSAPYKLLIDEHFLVFSPESFVRITGNRIFSFPMKGTISATVPGAIETILHDKKEIAEHVTIVDLIRNDLSIVATNVRVPRFRFVDEIRTNRAHLFQISSEVTGDLPATWRNHLGSMLLKLLPAGSVTGAPKARTVEIIRNAEGEERGYYTGVFGIFDGDSVDSAVMIRYIEKDNGRLYYRSGGGITTQSVCESEYQEALDKIYVPVG